MTLRRQCSIAAVLLLLAGVAGASRPCRAAAGAAVQPFRNFKVTVYIPVQAVEHMAHDPAWMRSSWRTIGSRLHVDQVFIEDYRSGVSADDAAITQVKQFFVSQGVAVAGGMAMLGAGRSAQFQTLDYTVPRDRELASRMSALLARHFDTFVLDDLYFFNTKSDADIAAKGRQSWAQFRMRTMDEVSRDLILKPAKAANPKVKVIIKFPNFYPSFQEMGFDLKNEPQIFPEIWTGDETRYAPTTDQQLRPYESYEIFRYFENIAPGRNGGGWVDPIAMQYLDRYAGQLWDTILAKAPAINLFQYTDLLRVADPRNRDAWEHLPTTFDYFDMMRQCCGGPPGAPGSSQPLLADAVEYALRKVDDAAGSLGQPVGLATYRPYDSTGEDFLPETAGMVGIPVEMYPRWPDATAVLLTQAAAADPNIVPQIEHRLRKGDSVIITSGLLRAIQDKGFDQVTDMRVTHDVVPVSEYVAGFGFGAGTVLGHSKPILFPLIHFYTNEAWAVLRGVAAQGGVPLLLMDHYGKGELYVLAVPEEMNDLYALPAPVLNELRRYLTADLPVRLEGPSQVSLFEYGNGTFVVESYLDRPAAVRVIGGFAHLKNLTAGTALDGEAEPEIPGFLAPPSVTRVLGDKSAKWPQASLGDSKHFGYELRIEPHSFVTLRAGP
ncbi:MAG TPA: hypothetical protein VGN43_22140 [Steroidobacteraceae bacterium]|jgi:hypothetical protein|nr:hypothetical protein [Steroidobacteraceae bacterium]